MLDQSPQRLIGYLGGLGPAGLHPQRSNFAVHPELPQRISKENDPCLF